MMFVVAASILFALLALACCGAALAWNRMTGHDSIADALAARIDTALPQTQCARCVYPACRPYAEAIARGEAPINRCPPGGDAGIRALAELTGQPVQPLDPECGSEMPPRVAIIDEDACIGCTKCIQACPADAIVGAAKLMHTVIPQLCTGCELCIPPCPVDCIDMVPAGTEGRPVARPVLPHAA
ncbi:MAG TPA: RnfABCDGE type electron transport complex subunit B [Rhodanobacteraceae bacterium]|nr:RnfABCDGE type electron transport complex subunit B [Rhodanobacteraceae bacterium]